MNLKQLIVASGITLLLAGCGSSVKLDETSAPIDNRSGTAAAGGAAGAGAGGATAVRRTGGASAVSTSGARIWWADIPAAFIEITSLFWLSVASVMIVASSTE